MERGGRKITGISPLSPEAQAALDQVETIVDALGLEPEMKSPVAAVHLLGIETFASCQGHAERGHSFPWIDTKASAEQRAWIQKQLPAFHFVQKGFAGQASWRLVPSRVLDIGDHQEGAWESELLELSQFATDVLQGKLIFS